MSSGMHPQVSWILRTVNADADDDDDKNDDKEEESSLFRDFTFSFTWCKASNFM
jgi:hypothetical protein